ncbi:FHA domain-containing protein [Rhizobium halophytocola]|uniref:Type VI secretion system protein ImpI n=1 Tax=Rhizobium halophytocola TaxID=735519 RepID=A0ABS4E680_9HYPH|nr:FHA domain-containing protein [Rhizobium halophytocola]MBP1853451.1 type VI secretion system protein ImpI [Rhizobium halophytocola]
MKLELRYQDETGARGPAPFVLEHGKRTLGRSRDCDWQVDVDDRRISKVHCVIQRVRDGYELVDRSANGTRIDGRILEEGQGARLTDGCTIALGARNLTARISGEQSEEMPDPAPSLRVSDETLTISSILADVAPGGQMARGILGRKDGDDSPGGVRDTGRKRGGISRQVQVGWDSPPVPGAGDAVLPENWFEDEDAGSRTEHVEATRASVAIARPAGRKKAVLDDFEDVFPDEPEPQASPAAAVTGPTSAATAAQVAAPDLGRLKVAVSALERASEDVFALLSMERSEDRQSGAQSAEDRLAARIETLTRDQQAFAGLLETMLREATRRLEPRIIEARLEASGNPLKRLFRPNHWDSYKAQFDSAGETMNVTRFLQQAAHGALPDPEEADRRAQSDMTGKKSSDET